MTASSDYRLPGSMVRRLMRNRGITIRALARRWNVTMKRVRQVRKLGVRGFAANERQYMITGAWLDGPTTLASSRN